MSPSSRRAPVITAALLLLTPLAAAAQGTTTTTTSGSGTIVPTPDSLGGEDIPAGEPIRIGVAHCQDADELVIRLDNVPTGKASLDVYVGTDCTRTDRDTEDVPGCDFVTNEPIGSTADLEVSIPVDAIALAGDSSASCDKGGSEEPTLWFLAVDVSQSNEDVGNSFASVKIEIDLEAPDSPVNVRGGSGENQIPVRWDFEDTSEEIERFIVLVDPTSGTPSPADGGTAACGSGALVEGESAEGLSASVRQRRVDNPAADDTTVSADDVTEDGAAVAVIAVDFAGNRSPISNIACLSVVPTTGYKDLYEQQNGAIESGCPCSAPGKAQAEGALPIALALGLIAARARRRRS